MRNSTVLLKAQHTLWLLPKAIGAAPSTALACISQDAAKFCSAAAGDSPGRAAAKPPLSQKVKFVDARRIEFVGGTGGGGNSSLFGRSGVYPRAAGGKGGKGGSLILRASKRALGLGALTKLVQGEQGKPGGKQWCVGANGEDRVVHVPLGTMVKLLADLDDPEAEEKWRLEEDRDYEEQEEEEEEEEQPELEHGWQQRQEQQRRQEAQQRQGRARLQPSRPRSFEVSSPAVSAGVSSTGDGSSSSSSSSRGGSYAGPAADAVLEVQSGRPTPLQHGRASLFDMEGASRRSLDSHSTNVGTSASSSSGSSNNRDSSSSIHRSSDSSVSSESSSDSNSDSSIDSTSTSTSSTSYSSSGTDGISGSRGSSGTTDNSYFDALLSDRTQLTAADKRRLWLGLQSPDDADMLPTQDPHPYHRGDSDFSSSSSGSSSRGSDSSGSLGGSGHMGGGDGFVAHQPPAVGSDMEWREPWAAPAHLSKKQVLAVLTAQAEVLGELTEEGQELRVAEGGAGGFGNAHFKSKPWGPASRRRLPGRPGQRRLLLLEAKIIADVALVGLPNAGKSTLLSALTAARAQVGSYAFTTLRPQLGTVQYPDGSSLTVADIPGLIEGAHANRGKGNAFLRHIERSRCLAFVVDLSGGAHPSSLVALAPEQQLRVLEAELRLYHASLLRRAAAVVVANKVDDCGDAAGALARLKACTAWPVVPVSAAHAAGLDRLRHALRALVSPAAQDG